MTTPAWLDQVQKFETPADLGSGEVGDKAAVGVALGVIAEAMDAEDPQIFRAGEVAGAVIEKDGATVEVVFVSSGRTVLDMTFLCERYEVSEAQIALMSAAVMLLESHRGAAVVGSESITKMLLKEVFAAANVIKADYRERQGAATDFSEKNIFAAGQTALGKLEAKLKSQFGLEPQGE